MDQLGLRPSNVKASLEREKVFGGTNGNVAECKLGA